MTDREEILRQAADEMHRLSLLRYPGPNRALGRMERSAMAAPELYAQLAQWMRTEDQTWKGDEAHYACTSAICTWEAAEKVAMSVLEEAYGSCSGREEKPNLCRCPCYGCRHNCSAHTPLTAPEVQ
jgi:hypothetical protein